MSLTSELAKKDSRIKLLLKKHFSNTRPVMKQCRERMAGTTTLRAADNLPWGLIGTALDYRIRFYYPPKPNGFMDLVARKGAEVACGKVPIRLTRTEDGKGWQIINVEKEDRVQRRSTTTSCFPLETAITFFLSFEKIMQELSPVNRRLDHADEEHLLRYCWVLALFERFFREGADRQSDSPLLKPQPKATVEELVAIAADDCIDDLRQLSWAFYDQFGSMLSKPAKLNPTFTGSTLVGGADADLIVDGSLIDIKTTINPLADSTPLYQLLGYVLLDTDDIYQINNVAIYYSRQAFLLDWSLDDLMTQLAGGYLPDLSSLRKELYEAYIKDDEGERMHQEWLEFMRAKGFTMSPRRVNKTL